MSLRLATPERRHSIVAAAVPLFARKGFAGTTTREIAEAAGVSEALVFKHFASKTALYEAILERCRDVDPALARLQSLPPGTATLIEIVQQFLAHFMALGGPCDEHKAHHRLFLRSLIEDGEFARAGLRTLSDVLMPLFTESYEAARAAGDLDPARANAAAAFWFMAQVPLMLGSIVLTGADSAMDGFSADETLRALLRGIGLHDACVTKYSEPDRTICGQTDFAAAS